MDIHKDIQELADQQGQAAAEAPKEEEEDDGEEVDDQGLESKDIELVMAQVNPIVPATISINC